MEDNLDKKKTILIVDDEKPIVEILVYNLQREGYNTLEANDGVEAVNIALEKKPDLILLDVMLPKMNGKDACRRIRYSLPHVPILMLSAKAEEIDKVLGLELGADDYITKPFSVSELKARINAHLRRAEINKIEDNTPVSEEKAIIKQGPLTMDLKKQELKVNGQEVKISSYEFKVLKYLMENPGQIITRETFMQKVWGYDNFSKEDEGTRTVDVTVRRLRERIENDTSNPKIILTKRGVGYYIAT